MKRIFKRKEKTRKVEFKAYATGEIVPLENVPDPVFSEKMMGEGIAIKPSEGKVTSPVEGKVIQTLASKHAVGIKATNGAEILIHIGLETVSLKGRGFTVYVKEGQKVKVGDPLIDVDLDVLESENIDAITPLVITNSNDMESIEVNQSVSKVKSKDDMILSVAAK